MTLIWIGPVLVILFWYQVDFVYKPYTLREHSFTVLFPWCWLNKTWRNIRKAEKEWRRVVAAEKGMP